ncbi:hypothetical protein CXB51_011463 [Gossypium anomalum]|uniref:Uncharacterized protein n=1 Tax=Gossypium anomalum TaxID=47600 RepID=A0A8J5YPU7_9ROSI|nr:hypothetical protein CXB51_011463 [Gossypium anomalum]
MSASFQEDKGSFLWVLAPIALISSLILPQFFFSSAIEAFFKDDTLVGLRVYLSSSFFTMGFKVVAPLLPVFLTWPALGFQDLVAVDPFLIGCAAQHAFKTILDHSTCINHLVYRLYQLTRAIQLIQNFTVWMKDSQRTPEMFKQGGATAGMVVTFQVLAVVCLWSLMTFLQRPFPSRPVAEKYL